MKEHTEKDIPLNQPIDGDGSTESFDAMTPVELADALERTLDATTEENCDLDALKACLDALDRKAPLGEEPDGEAAMDKVWERLGMEAPAPVRRRRGLRRWTVNIVAAAAILFVLVVGAQAAGFNIFGALARWNSEIFHFETAADGSYETVRKALEENGIPGELAPTWYPEGFEIGELKVWTNEIGTIVQVPFSNTEGKKLFVNIVQYDEASSLNSGTYEKDGTKVEIYTSNSKTFYILSNINTTSATWAEETLSETITGKLSVDEMKKIIDSIGGS